MRIHAYTTTDENNYVDKHMTLNAILDGTLRAATSILAPVITIEFSSFPSGWTHIYIQDFSRYYYITDIVAVSNKIYDIHTKVDVLQSYCGSRYDETGIFGMSGFLIRNEFLHNYLITDTTYPTKCKPVVARYTAGPLTSNDEWWGSSYYLTDTSYNRRYYMLAQGKLTNAGGTSLGSTIPLASLVCNKAHFVEMINILKSGNVYSTLTGKPLLDYIYQMGCLPCPIPCSSEGGPVTTLDVPGLNSITIPSVFYPTSDATNITTVFRATITKPSSTKHYLNRQPYANYTVTFQPFGKYELDGKYFVTNDLNSTFYVYFRVVTDFITGNALLYYGNTADAPVYLGSANVQYRMPLSASAFNGAAVASSAVSIVANAASMVATEGATAPAAIPAMIGSTMAGANSLANPATTVTGGDTKIIDHRPIVEVSYQEIASTQDPHLFGESYCQPVAIKDVYGYSQFGKVHVEGIAATAAEKDEIESLLRSGVIFRNEG